MRAATPLSLGTHPQPKRNNIVSYCTSNGGDAIKMP